MHGLILTGNTYQTLEHKQLVTDSESEELTEIKRTPGAHRIATHLREQGWDIEVIDYAPGWTLEEFKELGKSRITKKTVFVGVSRMFQCKDNLKIFLKHIKETYPHVTTIAGSRNLGSIIDLHTFADYFVNGYGEYGLTELLKKLTGNSNKCVIENLTDHWGRTFPTVHSDKWHPAFPKKDLHITYEARDFIQEYEILSMELARGCIFKCKFCNFGVTGIKGDYTRSMRDLDRDLRTNYDLYGTKSYYLADETINDTTEKLERIASVTRNLSFQPSFSGFMRGDLVVGRQQDWPLISEIGLNGHFYGIETLTHKAGRYVGKGMKTDILKQGLIDAKKYFLKHSSWHRTTISLIIGLPGETEEEYWDGINWLNTDYKINGVPAQISAGALWVTKHKGPIRTSYSEFDETWEETGDFEEMSIDEISEDDKKKFPGLVSEVTEALTGPGLLWKHKDMNRWDALKIEKQTRAKIHSGEVDNTVGIWMDHNYLSTGLFTHEDLMKPIHLTYPKTGQMVAFWKKHIDDYKQKKLSLR